MFKDLIHDIDGQNTVEFFTRDDVSDDSSVSDTDIIYIDAGTKYLRLQACAHDGSVWYDKVVPSNSDLRDVLSSAGLLRTDSATVDPARIVITGKLAGAVRERLVGGKQILPTAAFWLAAQDLVELPENANVGSLAIIDLSASGYLVIGVDRTGRLKDDLLVVNPRCGAGSGINIDRVLQKLALAHDQVDVLLEAYLGEDGRELREAATVRVDRCGVFSTSATISDKNQGIPLDTALATTLKSEVLKTVKKLPAGFDKVYLTGRIFTWQFTRDCAEDLLRAQGVTSVAYDSENTQLLKSLRCMVARVGVDNLAQPDHRLVQPGKLEELPSFIELRNRYEKCRHYRRLSHEPFGVCSPEDLSQRSLILALDVGSTMAKVVLADADTGDALFLDAYSNAGDTIETVKKVFADLQRLGIERLPLQSVGITGSARYQVQQALARIYPDLSERVSVLVENYAHARGSIDYARRHVKWLEEQSIEDVNKSLCILVDIGGEDTKISTIALNEAELFDNAMNTKCSAGTGSLMDTLSTMFGLESVAEAQALAYNASKSFGINATCAVFLMENASKLQTQGVPKDEILASANWAIVENMARTLWSQLDLPANTVVLLHGQTMLSDPLPLAVTHRLHSYIGADIHALLPPHPGHRACFGLIYTLQQEVTPGIVTICLNDLLEAHFEKRVIQCKGKVCGDPQARCNRCALRWQSDDGRKVAFTVGGCTAINELISNKGQKKTTQPQDTYQAIWNFIDSHHPHSDDSNRLVIARSFVVSEWAYFLSRLFESFDIPVHVDNVCASDLSDAQPQLNIDCCAPQMGAIGQYSRLAGEPHGMILAPQIETIPTDGVSSGTTCTTNQGGVAVASNLAMEVQPDANFHLFHFHIDKLDSGHLCDQLMSELEPIFRYYGITIDAAKFEGIIARAIDDHLSLRRKTADFAAELAQNALDEGHKIALVVGREYILNPGIYDSHIRRLLRERQMAVIPSYVLDVDLDPEFSDIYWRNPHFILTLLKAVAHRKLHHRLRHAGLQSVFRQIEEDKTGTMLPVVQVSTFSCGPDSIITHYVAEIMKERPFLLIQSDAVLKELAHLENRVNTYVKQLEQRLHDKLEIKTSEPFQIRMLDELLQHEPLNPETDVLCLPTLGDNRSVTSVFRAVGYTCIDNYSDETYDLQGLVKTGRKSAGQSVCAPLAAMYADLTNGVDEFVRHKQAGDARFVGKRRLVLIDTHGAGPCRQGQYPGLHKLFFHNSMKNSQQDRGCNSMPAGALFEFMLLNEDDGYQGSFPNWMMLRVYQGMILKGILQSIHFKAGAACRDYEEYQHFMTDFHKLQAEIYEALERFKGPGRLGRLLLSPFSKHSVASLPIKYFAYRMHGREFIKPLKRFAAKWTDKHSQPEDKLDIMLTGEGYMRLAQSDEIFRILLGEMGFRRFNLKLSPILSYLECLLGEAEESVKDTLKITCSQRSRKGTTDSMSSVLKKEKRKLRMISFFRLLLRKGLAQPLYKASKQQIPPPTSEMIEVSRELLPTYRPKGELAPYIGEVLVELRDGFDVVLNVAPNGCMVASMGEMLTPSIMHADGVGSGRIQTLLSAEGDVNQEALTHAILKAVGPQRYYQVHESSTV